MEHLRITSPEKTHITSQDQLERVSRDSIKQLQQLEFKCGDYLHDLNEKFFDLIIIKMIVICLIKMLNLAKISIFIVNKSYCVKNYLTH